MPRAIFPSVLSRRALGVVILGFLWSISVSAAYAGELKVFDPRGLIRGQKEIRGTATVVITVAVKVEGQSMLLSNVNGLAPDISGRAISPRIVQFDKVPEGEWKIQTSGSSTPVQTVEIKY